MISRLPIPRRLRRSRRVQERKDFFERAASLAPMVAVDTGPRGRFLIQTEDKHIGKSLFVAGSRQEMDTLDLAVQVIQTNLGPDALTHTTLIDVGANIGTTTVPALLTGPFERAVAIEPEAHNFSTLRMNVQLNGLEAKVVTLRAAVSSGEGSVRLLVTPGRSGKHRLTGPSDKGDQGVEVRSTTVDTVMQRENITPSEVGLLWIDAEGSEDRVLAGAGAILAQCRPVVLELNPLQVERTGGSQAELEQRIGDNYSHFVALSLSAGADHTPRPSEELPRQVRALGKGKKLDVLLLDLRASNASSRAAAVRSPA